jgi:hypothetical protein
MAQVPQACVGRTSPTVGDAEKFAHGHCPVTLRVRWVGDGEQAYAAQGISNDLMTDLSRLPGLRDDPGVRGTDAPCIAKRPVSGIRVASSGHRKTLRNQCPALRTPKNESSSSGSERFERPFRDLFGSAGPSCHAG